MSRITAPASKLSRAVAPALRDSHLHTSGAVLTPKYAELLRTSLSSDHGDSPRGLSTAHRPTPQPSLANRAKPLMQTFHSAAPSASAAASPANLDAAIFPSMADLFASSDPDADAGPRMPLLPDNYSAAHGPTPGDGPVHLPSIIAADPENVLPAAPLSDLEAIGLDAVDLKFAHDDRHSAKPRSDEGDGGGMIRDLWKGIVDDVLGPAKK